MRFWICCNIGLDCWIDLPNSRLYSQQVKAVWKQWWSISLRIKTRLEEREGKAVCVCVEEKTEITWCILCVHVHTTWSACVCVCFYVCVAVSRTAVQLVQLVHPWGFRPSNRAQRSFIPVTVCKQQPVPAACPMLFLAFSDIFQRLKTNWE